MPAHLESQRRGMAMALSIKRGETPVSKARGAVRHMMSMSEVDLEDYASKIKKPRKKAKK